MITIPTVRNPYLSQCCGDSQALSMHREVIASPSRLFKEELGFNLVYGLAEGVDDKVKTAVRAVNAMGQDVMTAAQKSLNMSWNVGCLVPAAGTSVVNNYYNNDNSRTVNQTNNSPKALSRLEIYRQTKNALKT